MEKYKVENGCNIFSWCPNINNERATKEQLAKNKDFQTAIEQMEDVARLPFVSYLAMMPDAHAGYSLSIGGVCGCDNVVVPAFVGFDIACGMSVMRTNLKRSQLQDISLRKDILKDLHKHIPVSFHHNSQQQVSELKNWGYDADISKALFETQAQHYIENSPWDNSNDIFNASMKSLATMGGNNHFIELQYDTDDNVWCMIHSGSRNIGMKIGQYFNDLALETVKKYYSKSDVGFFPMDTLEGKAYWAWMKYAEEFSYFSKHGMMKRVQKVLHSYFPELEINTSDVIDDCKDNILTIHHNFASIENHFGRNHIVHRKGATRAFKGQTGIIPSSMGTPSYIVKGKGVKSAFMSCSHGTGRKMGRNEFNTKMKENAEFNINRIENSLKDVVHSDFGEISRGKNKGMINLSESPECYKDGRWVMECQKDLVDVVEELHPMICVKGLKQ